MANERLPLSLPAPPKTFKGSMPGANGKKQEISITLPAELVTWFEQVRTMLDVAYGSRTEAEGMRFVTVQELVNAGLI